jgi:hypothetical protein
MAVVVIATTPGMTAELYEQSLAKSGTAGTLPPGCSAHIAGPSPDGWRVVAVWESAGREVSPPAGPSAVGRGEAAFVGPRRGAGRPGRV